MFGLAELAAERVSTQGTHTPDQNRPENKVIQLFTKIFVRFAENNFDLNFSKKRERGTENR